MGSKNAKALFLGSYPPEKKLDHNITGLVRLFNELNVNLIRFAEYEWQKYKNIEEFAETFKQSINDADFLMSSGNLRWLTFFKDQFGVRKHFEDAITSGKPFIFQGVRAWDKYFTGILDEEKQIMRDFFSLIGVTPTDWRVYTKDTASNVGGGSVAYFREGDGCFLNAGVLGEVESLLITQPNVVDYRKGAFPVVETGPLHDIINSGDLPDNLSPGIRPAVFLEIRDKLKNGYFISGDIILDGYQSITGEYVPGFEKNKTVVQALIKNVLKFNETTQSEQSKAYDDLFDLEKSLAEILVQRLPTSDTALLREQNLKDIIELATLNWKYIEDLFPHSDAKDFSKSLAGIPVGARNYLCHPVKSEFEEIRFDSHIFKQLALAAQFTLKAKERL